MLKDLSETVKANVSSKVNVQDVLQKNDILNVELPVMEHVPIKIH